MVNDCCEIKQRQPGGAGLVAARLQKLTEALAWSVTVMRLKKDSLVLLGWLLQGSRNHWSSGMVSDSCETDQRQPTGTGLAAARLYKLTEVLAWSVTVVRLSKDSLVVLGWLLQGSRNSLKLWHGQWLLWDWPRTACWFWAGCCKAPETHSSASMVSDSCETEQRQPSDAGLAAFVRLYKDSLLVLGWLPHGQWLLWD